MIEIIPAIMPRNYNDLVETMGIFVGVVPLVQLDIMDGKFVPNRTWPYPRDSFFDAVIAEEQGMPYWEDLDFEADLMIGDPETWTTKWVSAGARRIIVHIESVQEFEIIRSAVPSLVELGLAINTTTPISAIEPYLNRVEFIQCMGIARIGFQGEGFDERVLEHIRAIRALRPEMPISVDGAVNFETAQRLVEAGATRLVSGSAILKSNDVREAVDTLKDLVQ